MKTLVTTIFASPKDAEHFVAYTKKAKASEGTVSGIWAGIMCSALKFSHATIEHTHGAAQAIETKIIPASNTRATRIKASCDRGSITIDYPHDINGQDNIHRVAVDALISRFLAEDEKQYNTPRDKNPWARPYVTGGTKTGYAHVFIS